MSATTCFLTPVRVLVTQRMEAAEKFMTLEDSCPPSKTASSLPPSLWTALLCSLPSTLNLPQDSAAFPSSVQTSTDLQSEAREGGDHQPYNYHSNFRWPFLTVARQEMGREGREDMQQAMVSLQTHSVLRPLSDRLQSLSFTVLITELKVEIVSVIRMTMGPNWRPT
ncbi:hypothetical protein CHARACLAT_007199 [Characodon lateralis]|uniref:Uncharacterized protein n=1 Tax=Characodon lateralis TaxID=208331 RepID=A0ABU7ERL8_9TELE|nr:hypothetical protein [Characodon lateralis]